MRCSSSKIRAAFASASGDAGELQDGGDVRLIARPDLRHARRRVEVVVAVGHSQAALQQEGRIAAGVVEVLRDPEAEEVGGVEVRVVQDVDVGAQRALRARARAPGRRRSPRSRSSAGWSGCEALRLDGRLVHEGRVGVADLPRVRAGGRLRLRRLGDQVGRPPGRQLDEHAARRPSSSGRPGSRWSSATSRSRSGRSRLPARPIGRCRRDRCRGKRNRRGGAGAGRRRRGHTPFPRATARAANEHRTIRWLLVFMGVTIGSLARRPQERRRAAGARLHFAGFRAWRRAASSMECELVRDSSFFVSSASLR